MHSLLQKEHICQLWLRIRLGRSVDQCSWCPHYAACTTWALSEDWLCKAFILVLSGVEPHLHWDPVFIAHLRMKCSKWAFGLTTMDKPNHEREHNDCQQLITKSHGQSWLDSNIQPQEESNAYLSVKERVTVNVTCQCSENSYFWRAIDHKYQATYWGF